jgi:3D (Asp-Asp-Asp) domain-containing protein
VQGPPPADVTAADSIEAAATAGADTATVPPPVERAPSPTVPPALVPKRRLFRSLEERARAGERIAVSVTAYCLQGRTRRGNPVRDGIIAVDRTLFPLGREVDLFFGRRAYGRFLADDTGGVIKGGRIDVYENEGKRSGAYSAGVYGVGPYVLLNYNDTQDALFTFAHEMGHAMHTRLSEEAQPFVTSSYTIFVAEVASTVNERLMLDHLLARETDPARRFLLLQHAVDSIVG